MADMRGSGYDEQCGRNPRFELGGNNNIIASDAVIMATLHVCNGRQSTGPLLRSGGPTRVKIRNIVMSRCRLQVYYEGKVQGVGFRYTVKTLAGGFDLTGTVRNLPDGRVELVAEGAKDELSAFQQAIRESELGHFIAREQLTWHEPQGGLRGFEIAR